MIYELRNQWRHFVVRHQEIIPTNRCDHVHRSIDWSQLHIRLDHLTDILNLFFQPIQLNYSIHSFARLVFGPSTNITLSDDSTDLNRTLVEVPATPEITLVTEVNTTMTTPEASQPVQIESPLMSERFQNLVGQTFRLNGGDESGQTEPFAMKYLTSLDSKVRVVIPGRMYTADFVASRLRISTEVVDQAQGLYKITGVRYEGEGIARPGSRGMRVPPRIM